jgi:hypothetical protein
MTLKASVSVLERQDAFAREGVAQACICSLNAVVQHELELLHTRTEREVGVLAALRAFFAERRDGAFENPESSRTATAALIGAKRAAHGQ